MKRIALSLGLIVASATLALTGCTAESTSKEDKQVVSGKLEGQGGTSTKSFLAGGVQITPTRVIAHQLGAKGVVGKDVISAVGADGSFRLDLDRGARYVLEVDKGGAGAIVGFHDKSGKMVDVLPVASSTAGKAQVDVGKVHVASSGGGAAVEVSPLKSFDEADLTGLPPVDHTWFVKADGSIASAEEALKAAEAALKEAEKAVADAQSAAQKAADEAATAAEAAKAAQGQK